MSLQGRDYQLSAVSAVFSYFTSKSGNPLVAMPTGTGKSVVIALLLQAIFHSYPRQRVMVLTHVKELIRQNHAKLLEAWPTAPAGIYSAGLNRRDTLHKIVMAGIASVAKRAAEFGHVDLVFVDEAHLVSPSDEAMYQRFFAALRTVNPWLKVVGFTATPWRLQYGHIAGDGGIFTDVCFDITDLHSFNRLLAEGYLCPLVPKRTDTQIDVAGVAKRGGEFVPGDLQAAVDQQPVTDAALREAVALGADRRSWLLFCSGVEHAEHVAATLTSLGVQCAAVHSKSDNRDETIAAWKAGKLQAIANNNVMTTGIDHPGLDLIVMLRPTASTVLWVQMLGRGTRPLYAPGYNLHTAEGRLGAMAASIKRDCLVLDFAGNTRRLGPINDPVIPKKKGEAAGDAPVKLCPACATYNHASASHCSYCGHEFPKHAPKVYSTAGTEALIKASEPELPIISDFSVDHVTYDIHRKAGKPPSMSVSYYCGIRMFRDYVCFEHQDGLSRRKAQNWWKARVPGTKLESEFVPTNTQAAVSLAQHLKAPTHLRVWVNEKYPRIMGECFDGSAFGKQEPSAGTAPSTDTRQQLPERKPGASFDDMDDDIPF